MALTILLSNGCDTSPAGFARLTNIYGGSGEYSYTLANGLGVVSYQGYVTSAQLAKESLDFDGLYDSKYTLSVQDSQDDANTGGKEFTVNCGYKNPDFIIVSSACNYSGVGNKQGSIEINYDPSQVYDILLTGPDGYSKTKATADGTYAGKWIFIFVPNGKYHLEAYNASNVSVYSQDINVDCPNSNPLSVISTPTTDASSATTADGAVEINIEDGVSSGAQFIVQTHLGDSNWIQAPANGNSKYKVGYSGRLPGEYTVFVRDTVGQTTQAKFTIGHKADGGGPVTPPVEVPKAVFNIPLLNSLRYVVNEGDGMPNFDNRLYCKEEWPGIYKVPYYQKITREDRVVTQFKSNYPTHVATLYDYESGASVKTLAIKKLRQNIGLTRLYSSWLTAHPQDVTKSRLYFNGGDLPLDFVAGDTVKIQNALPSTANGSRTVDKVTFSPTDYIPYLVLNWAYPIGTARVNVNVSTTYDTLPYDVFEFPLDLAGVANGVYVVKLTATSPDYATVEAITEPVVVQTAHINTHLFTWRNVDDAHGLIFTDGLICGLRIESDLFERIPGGTRKVHDLPNGRLLKLASTAIRKAQFSTRQLPPWLHEKIAFAFDLDHIEINGIEYQTREQYEAETSKILGLRNGSVNVEQVSGEAQNSTDLGSILSGKGFIIVNDGKYLKA